MKDAFVYGVDGAMPRLALFHRVRTAANGSDALHTIVASGFDYRGTAIVEGDAPRVSGDSRDDRVQVLERNSQRVEADVTTGSDALLMQNDTWYPGWKATVDGRETPILVADYLFRGIAIPAGHHRVVIAYRSSAVYVGLAISFIGIALLVGMFVLVQLPRPKFRRSAIEART